MSLVSHYWILAERIGGVLPLIYECNEDLRHFYYKYRNVLPKIQFFTERSGGIRL
jgi:hypothetical protein